jgi:DNA anti-recombination protein RmuC
MNKVEEMIGMLKNWRELLKEKLKIDDLEEKVGKLMNEAAEIRQSAKTSLENDFSAEGENQNSKKEELKRQVEELKGELAQKEEKLKEQVEELKGKLTQRKGEQENELNCLVNKAKGMIERLEKLVNQLNEEIKKETVEV